MPLQFLKRLFIGRVGKPYRVDYATFEDARLLELYAERESLTEQAGESLAQELARRGLLEQQGAADAANDGESPPAAGGRVDQEAKRALGELVRGIIQRNLFDFEVFSLRGDFEVVLSPIWERGPTGNAIRRAALLKRSMRAHYFEGKARSFLESAEVVDVSAALLQREVAISPRDAAGLFSLYCSSEAPYLELEDEPWSEVLGGISLVIADAARQARVGISARQIIFPGHAAAATASAKLELDRIEHNHVLAVVTAPVEELLRALEGATHLRRAPAGSRLQ